ncbi:GGDEF domain-containing protein [Xanthomonas maliensis]|uniref:GGDEF domain-containing protein n=1 Tax=Xanthomonas maliensis TaxID=1321368 RepID=UPI00039EC066|nr:sensor domain-containing diguanylate cyclase [Xanthomonas maliensis]KAB7771524.1 GGDEF domain-containing protein [Xanthomonas maliensis]
MIQRHSRRQLAQRLALLVFLLTSCAFLIVSEYWSIQRERQATLATAQAHALNLANSLAQHTSDTFAIAEAVLSGLVDRIESQTPQAAAGPAMHAFLVREARRSDRIHGFFIYAADGHWVNSSLDSSTRLHNNGDRPYFIYHRSHPDRRVHVGKPVQSRSDGSWVITLSRRLDTRNGRFAGVVVATLRLRYFARYYSTFDVGRNGTIGMADDDGTVIVRWPDRPELVDASIAGSALYAAMRQQGDGSTRYVSPIDHVERIASFARARPYPLTTLAGISIADALAPWRTSVRHRIVIATLGVVLLLGVGLWLDLQLRRMHRQESQLSSQARVDALTGIANRRTFDHHLTRALEQTQRARAPISLLMIDVDHFKRYNDHYGHVGGDACLRLVAGAIAQQGRRVDAIAARYGGEEFALILPFTDADEAWQVAEQVRAAIHALGLPHAASPNSAQVTVSIGMATFLPDAPLRLHDALVHDADAALYRAKLAGRDTISC